MRDAFHEDLDSINQTLVEMSTLVAGAMGRATQALLTANLELAEEVIADDDRVDAIQHELDNKTLDVMARQQPVASDLRNLVSQINIKQTSGVSMVDMVSSGATNQVTSVNIAGTGVAIAKYGIDYTAGIPNYVILGISPDNFKDATTKTDYIMGSSLNGTSKFQVAATMENDGTKTALVMGTYNARGLSNSASGTYASVGGKHTVTHATGKGLFMKGDTILGVTNAKIESVSADLQTLTLDANVGSSGTLRLANAESAGLIAAKGATATGVSNTSTTYMPY